MTGLSVLIHAVVLPVTLMDFRGEDFPAFLCNAFKKLMFKKHSHPPLGPARARHGLGRGRQRRGQPDERVLRVAAGVLRRRPRPRLARAHEGAAGGLL